MGPDLWGLALVGRQQGLPAFNAFSLPLNSHLSQGDQHVTIFQVQRGDLPGRVVGRLSPADQSTVLPPRQPPPVTLWWRSTSAGAWARTTRSRSRRPTRCPSQAPWTTTSPKPWVTRGFRSRQPRTAHPAAPSRLHAGASPPAPPRTWSATVTPPPWSREGGATLEPRRPSAWFA